MGHLYWNTHSVLRKGMVFRSYQGFTPLPGKLGIHKGNIHGDGKSTPESK